MPVTPIVSRTAKGFAFAVFGAAGFGKFITFDHHPERNGKGSTILVEKIFTDLGAVFALGLLSFNAAMSRFSQPHIIHSLEEVVRGHVREINSYRVLSVMKSAGGQTGCLTLASFGILKASLTMADMPLAPETIMALPFAIFLFGVPFFIPFILPIVIPGFAVAYVGGAVVGQLLGRRILRQSVQNMAPLLSTPTASGLGHLSRLYLTHPWFARMIVFGTAAIAYRPTHHLDCDWETYTGSSDDGTWSYRRSFTINNTHDDNNNNNNENDSVGSTPHSSDGGTDNNNDNSVSTNNSSWVEVDNDNDSGRDNLPSYPHHGDDDDGGVDI